MMDMKLEVGKVYVRDAGEGGYITPSGRFARIEGVVQPDTQEYERGCRFFDHQGTLLLDDGSLASVGASTLIPRLSRLAKDSDFEDTSQELAFDVVAKVDLSFCKETSTKWRKSTHPNFSVEVGEVYVDRMGFLHLINAQKHFFGRKLRVSNHRLYDVTGSMIPPPSAMPSTKISMYDLIYQRL